LKRAANWSLKTEQWRRSGKFRRVFRITGVKHLQKQV